MGVHRMYAIQRICTVDINASGSLVLVAILEQVDDKHACSDTDRNISDIKSGPKDSFADNTELKEINHFAQKDSVNEVSDGTAE